jgi:hypothetical protein
MIYVWFIDDIFIYDIFIHDIPITYVYIYNTNYIDISTGWWYTYPSEKW